MVDRFPRGMVSVRVAAIALCGAVLAGAGCADEPPLPAYQGTGVCFPVSIQPDPSGRYLYVAGANFDRSFRGGIVRAFDTQSDTYVPATVEIGSFASAMEVQSRIGSDGKAKLRLFVATRDDDAVTAVDVERTATGEPALRCGGEQRAGCPEKCAEIARFGGNDEGDLDIGNDPVELSLTANTQDTGDLLHVVGTTDGKVAIVALKDRKDGAIDVTAVGQTKHTPGVSDAVTSPLTGRTYVSNSRSPILRNYSVVRATTAPPDGSPEGTEPTVSWDVQTHAFITLPSAGVGEYGRAMTLSTDGSKLYLAYRNPNSLVIVDIAPGLTGEPSNTLLAVVGLGGSPARIAVAPSGPDGRDLVYVSCFGSDDIWIVDPKLRSVRGVVRLPHSPYALTVVSDNVGNFALYASLFSRHTLARVPLVDGLPPAGDPSAWLELFATKDCQADVTPEEVKACN